MALERAALVVVQSLTALSLVIALPLGAVLTAQHIGRRELAGATLTLLGIVFFISAGQPQGGTSHPSATAWWSACLVTGALVLTLFGLGRRFTGAAKALTYGAAAGLGYGLQTAVTKTFVTEIGGGVLALLSSWSVYVLIISAVSGLALQQSALKTGVLAPAMESSRRPGAGDGVEQLGDPVLQRGPRHLRLRGVVVQGRVVALRIRHRRARDGDRRDRAPRRLRVPAGDGDRHRGPLARHVNGSGQSRSSDAHPRRPRVP